MPPEPDAAGWVVLVLRQPRAGWSLACLCRHISGGYLSVAPGRRASFVCWFNLLFGIWKLSSPVQKCWPRRAGPRAALWTRRTAVDSPRHRTGPPAQLLGRQGLPPAAWQQAGSPQRGSGRRQAPRDWRSLDASGLWLGAGAGDGLTPRGSTAHRFGLCRCDVGRTVHTCAPRASCPSSGWGGLLSAGFCSSLGSGWSREPHSPCSHGPGALAATRGTPASQVALSPPAVPQEVPAALPSPSLSPRTPLNEL